MASQRAMLCRLAGRKLAAGAGVGEAIIDCEHGAALIAAANP